MKRGNFIKSLTLALASLFLPKVNGQIKRIEVDGEIYLTGRGWKGIDVYFNDKIVGKTKDYSEESGVATISIDDQESELLDEIMGKPAKDITVFKSPALGPTELMGTDIVGGYRYENNIKDSKGNVISTEKVYLDENGKEEGRETITFGESRLFII